MKHKFVAGCAFVVSVASLLFLGGCGKVQAQKDDPAATAPPPTRVVSDFDATLFKVDHPEQFPLVSATAHESTSELVVTGTINPDVSRNIPVISLASGRVVAVHARLGDTVKPGQLLLSVRSDDVANGFADYRRAVHDENLARTQLERAKDLYSHGAMSLSDLQVAENAEANSRVSVDALAEHLRLLGNDPDKPAGIVDINAPAAGVITDQQITSGGGTQGIGSTLFTISDLSHVWIVCDVYENDLQKVRLGDVADIRLNAYPDRVLKGTISNIGAVLDPSLRTAKIRIEVQNPGLMRLGMFVTATFRGQSKETNTAVPASAILHIHDRDYVYVPTGDGRFRRVEVVGGDSLPDNMQEVKSGIKPGQQVVSNALILEHTIDQ